MQFGSTISIGQFHAARHPSALPSGRIRSMGFDEQTKNGFAGFKGIRLVPPLRIFQPPRCQVFPSVYSPRLMSTGRVA